MESEKLTGEWCPGASSVKIDTSIVVIRQAGQIQPEGGIFRGKLVDGKIHVSGCTERKRRSGVCMRARGAPCPFPFFEQY